jgi:hypothetical protein
MLIPVICGLATVKKRITNLELTVKSIINQVDKLIVYQNGYKEMFNFLENPKIEIISSLDTKIDMGDAGKFFTVGSYSNCYYLTIDDDLIYPEDYVSNITNHLIKFNNKVIVTHHGKIMKDKPLSYYNDISKNYRCLDEINDLEVVHFGGTGVMGIYLNEGHNLKFSYFKNPNMTDIWMGKYSEENNLPIIVLPHKKEWIKYSLPLDYIETIYRRYKNDHEVQNEVLKKMKFKNNHKISSFKSVNNR